jgi:serine/threonine protein kinase
MGNSLRRDEDIRKCYDLRRDILARGTYAVIRLAYRRSDRRPFAVKTIVKASLSARDTAYMRVEVALLNQVNHPHIIRLVEVFETDKKLYLVQGKNGLLGDAPVADEIDHRPSPNLYIVSPLLFPWAELLHGPSLFDHIVACRALPETQVRLILTQVGSGLQYLHRKKIYHRDLKPENIVFSTETCTDICLLDFGLAAHLDPAAIGRHHNLLKTACGSPEYAAPEILMGTPYDGEMADIWSLGVLLYTMLVGFNPFHSEDSRQVLDLVTSATYDFDDPEWKDVSDNAKLLVEQILQRHPRERLTLDGILHHPWMTVFIFSPIHLR